MTGKPPRSNTDIQNAISLFLEAKLSVSKEAFDVLSQSDDPVHVAKSILEKIEAMKHKPDIVSRELVDTVIRRKEKRKKKRKLNDKAKARNKLNELSGTEWIKFTKTWFIHRPPPRKKRKLLHPAAFPESLVKEFIEFFTKRNQLVLDPFLGTGSTLIACIESNRSGVGVEVVKRWADIAQQRVNEVLSQKKGSEHMAELMGLKPEKLIIKVIHGDSNYLSKIWKNNDFPPADYCITSPPYWNQLKRNYIRQKSRIEKGLDTKYSEEKEDVGNLDDYNQFLQALKQIFNEVYKVTKNKGYLTVITNNVFFDGRIYPLAFDTVKILSEAPYAWVPKDEKIWLQDDKPLIPLGVYSAWVGNRHHQYCLIFRKEE